MTTARNIFNKAISIIDELTDTGIINDAYVREYSARAPSLLDMWQKEMAKIENREITTEITDLDQIVEISDMNCPSGAYYLAEHFAMADFNEEIARMCRYKYRDLKQEATKMRPLDGIPIVDVYGITGTGV